MKVALVHELLTMRGGAERVLRILAEHFEDAPIYTLLYNEKKLSDWFPANRIRTPKVPFPMNLVGSYNHHLYLKHFPKMIESLDFSEFDLVISSSSAFAHNIITNGKPKHISYIHSPARYLWDRSIDVQTRANTGLLGPLKKWHLQRTFHPLRLWDCESSKRADVLLAASKAVQRRTELYWRRDSDVLYPPIADEWLNTGASGEGLGSRDNFLIVSTLVPYKRIDIAIQACNHLGVTLNIVGEGPDRKRLESMAGPTINFLGYQSHEELKRYYQNAKALIFPGEEDFGLVPIEAMSQGCPIVAFGKGGALETVVDGGTGTFFTEQTPENLAGVLHGFKNENFDVDVCRKRAEEFSRERFLRGLDEVIEEVMEGARG